MWFEYLLYRDVLSMGYGPSLSSKDGWKLAKIPFACSYGRRESVNVHKQAKRFRLIMISCHLDWASLVNKGCITKNEHVHVYSCMVQYTHVHEHRPTLLIKFIHSQSRDWLWSSLVILIKNYQTLSQKKRVIKHNQVFDCVWLGAVEDCRLIKANDKMESNFQLFGYSYICKMDVFYTPKDITCSYMRGIW